MGKGSPKPPTPAPLPPPPPPPPPAPEAPPTSPVISEDGATKKNSEANSKGKRGGTSSLRIDLNTGGARAGSGLNVQ